MATSSPARRRRGCGDDSAYCSFSETYKLWSTHSGIQKHIRCTLTHTHIQVGHQIGRDWFDRDGVLRDSHSDAHRGRQHSVTQRACERRHQARSHSLSLSHCYSLKHTHSLLLSTRKRYTKHALAQHTAFHSVLGAADDGYAKFVALLIHTTRTLSKPFA